jgi:hypothetical protein
VDATRAESGEPLAARHPWLAYGLFGGILMAGLTMTRLAVVKSQRLAGEFVDNVARRPSFTWDEILRIGLVMFAAGFVCGLLVRASRGLSVRYGVAGDVLVGMLVLNALLVMCLIAFDPEVLRKPWGVLLPLFGIATGLGAVLGFLLGREVRKELLVEKPKAGSPDDLLS